MSIQIIFPTVLQRFGDIQLEWTVNEASTVREALDSVFEINPRLRSYVLDDQGDVREHMSVYVDQELLVGKSLEVPIGARSEIFILQALSGG